MAGITLADAEAQLALWLAASTAVASKQSYSIGTRSLTLADAGEIREQIAFWNAQICKLDRSTTGGIKVRGVTPIT